MSVSPSVSASNQPGAPHATVAGASTSAPPDDGLQAMGMAQRDSTHPLDRPMAALTWSDPFRWLARGWHDFTQAPLIGLFFGACFAAMGWGLLAMFKYAATYTLALSAGFLLMGPFLCLGLYQASRAMERGLKPSLGACMMAWRQKGGAMATFGFMLLIIEMLWGRAAMIVFAVSFEGVPHFDGTVAQLLTPEYLPFVSTYLAVGALFAGLIFGLSVISIPMILEEKVDAISAALSSLRLVLTQTGVMLLWGGLITTIVLLGMLPGFMGLLVAGPLVGHASWHAYRAVMGPSAPTTEMGA